MRRLLALPSVALPLAIGLSIAPAAASPTAHHRPAPPASSQLATPDALWSTITRVVADRPAAPAAAPAKRAVKLHPHYAAMSAMGIKLFGGRVLAAAAAKAGTPYVYGAVGPGAFDCSGFTRYVYGQMGISLPHNSVAQYAVTQHISAAAARPGDLVFLSGLGHVGIYAGHGLMWDAPETGDHVRLRAMYGSYLVGRVTRTADLIGR